jgi:DNA-binding transcriptional LysR family regulator
MSNRTVADHVLAVGRHHLDLRVLSQYLIVCEAGSMGRAARKMGHSTPAVSQVILRLEHDLGVTLFERTSSGLRVTPAGVMLREKAVLLLESEAAALRALDAYRGQLLPNLRLYILDNIAIHLMNAIVPELTRLVRKVEVLSGRTLTHVRDFITGDIDILISPEDFPDVGKLDRYRLCRQELMAVAPASLARERREIKYLAETLPLIRFRENSRMDLIVQTYLDDHGLDLPRTIECDSPATVMELVTGGRAWSMVTPFAVSWFRRRWDRLAWLRLPGPVATDSLYLVASAERFLDLPATLANLSRAALREEVAAWSGTSAAPAARAVMVDPDD